MAFLLSGPKKHPSSHIKNVMNILREQDEDM
jgi:hypothetical protein